MRFKYVMLFLLTTASLRAQIHIAGEYDHISEIDSQATLVDAESGSEQAGLNTSWDSMGFALKTFDYDILSEFLTEGLQRELGELKTILSEYSTLFNSQGTVYYKGTFSDGFTRSGSAGLARFTHSDRSIGTLELMYTYKGERPIITEIMVVRNGKVTSDFPLLLKKIKKIKKQISAEKKNRNHKKILKHYEELVGLTEHLDGYYLNPKTGPAQRSTFYGNLAWYYALDNQADETIKCAKKGLEIWRYNFWIHTNLAVGHALKGHYEEASKIYADLCIRWNHEAGLSFKEVFINDLNTLKEEHIEVPHLAEYMELLLACGDE